MESKGSSIQLINIIPTNTNRKKSRATRGKRYQSLKSRANRRKAGAGL